LTSSQFVLARGKIELMLSIAFVFLIT
jgi:hypothetical protein